MTPASDIEGDGKPERLVLSMRVKVSVAGACFLVLLCMIAYMEMPNAVQALHGLTQGEDLDKNESQPSVEVMLTIFIELDGSIGVYSESPELYPGPWPIRREGDVYTLTDDILCGLIRVLSNDIVIDGAGHKVHGQGQEVGIDIRGEIYNNPHNVTLRNVEVTGYETGIYIECVDNCVLLNNTVTNNSRHGIWADMG